MDCPSVHLNSFVTTKNRTTNVLPSKESKSVRKVPRGRYGQGKLACIGSWVWYKYTIIYLSTREPKEYRVNIEILRQFVVGWCLKAKRVYRNSYPCAFKWSSTVKSGLCKAARSNIRTVKSPTLLDTRALHGFEPPMPCLSYKTIHNIQPPVSTSNATCQEANSAGRVVRRLDLLG